MRGLRWWRRARGLTQAGLAGTSGVERSHISKIERGLVEEPRPDTLLRLAGALGVEPFDLMFGEHSVGLFGPPEDLVRRGARMAPTTAPPKTDHAHDAPATHPPTTTAGGSR